MCRDFVAKSECSTMSTSASLLFVRKRVTKTFDAVQRTPACRVTSNSGSEGSTPDAIAVDQNVWVNDLLPVIGVTENIAPIHDGFTDGVFPRPHRRIRNGNPYCHAVGVLRCLRFYRRVPVVLAVGALRHATRISRVSGRAVEYVTGRERALVMIPVANIHVGGGENVIFLHVEAAKLRPSFVAPGIDIKRVVDHESRRVCRIPTPVRNDRVSLALETPGRFGRIVRGSRRRKSTKSGER